MRSDEFHGDTRVRCNARARKTKKKANSKAKRSPPRQRHSLLLHKIHGPSGSGIRRKYCSKCGISKWLKDFRISSRVGQGRVYRSECKVCRRAWEKKNSLRVKKRKRKAHRPALKVYLAEYYAANKPKYREYDKKARERDPDCNKKRSKKWQEKMKLKRILAQEALKDQDFV